MSILNLTLKKKWFDMIMAGEKTEEYREIKDYWVRRFIDLKTDMEFQVWDEFIQDLNNPRDRHYGIGSLLEYFNAGFKKFDAVKFTNGYGKKRPSAIFKLKELRIDTGKPEWGAIPDKHYFVFKLDTAINT